MRSFQFSDAKSHKFWQIEVGGTGFTVTYGKVGTAGQTSTKEFGTAEKAQAEADKLVREKTGKGYAETTATATVSSTEAMENACRANPHDTTAWSALADMLIENGDPRGEFMATQIALEDEALPKKERDDLKKKEKALLKTHEREWLGGLAEFALDAEKTKDYRSKVATAPVTHAFRRGWLAELTFRTLSVTQTRALAANPHARLLQTLVVHELENEAPTGQGGQYTDGFYEPGPDVPADVDEYEGPSLHALCRCPHLKGVRSFTLGEPTDNAEGKEEEYFNCHTPGELAFYVVKQMPDLEELYLMAHRVDANKIFPLPMPNLRVLKLYHSSSYPLEKLAANKTLGDLTHILTHPHALEYDDDDRGAYIRLKQLSAICRSKTLTSLTHLRLRLTDFGDKGAKEIVESGVLKRLKVLDLEGGCMTDEGALALAACPDLKNLEFLTVSNNALEEAGIAALKRTCVPVEADGMHGQTGEEDGDMPEYLYGGDIE